MSLIKLRSYQETAVAEIRTAFRAKQKCVLFVLPTGAGKTYTFSYIVDASALKGKRAMIIVHRKELLKQASKSLRAMGVEHGIIAPWATPNPRAAIQIASVDALASRLAKNRIYNVDFIVFDEAHHVLLDNKWGRVWKSLGEPQCLGVTATPKRGDGKGLGAHCGGIFHAMVVGPSVREIVAMGSLIAPKVLGCSEPPSIEGIKLDSKGELDNDELAKRTDKPHLIGDAVKHYTEVCPGALAVAFCVNAKHAIHVRDAFNAAGYKFALLMGEPHVSSSERDNVIRQLEAGELDGVTTVSLVSEGFDLPGLVCCLMLRALASEAEFQQQAGRVMRTADGKEYSYLLDHAGNVGRWEDGEFHVKHGLPTADRVHSLDGRKKKVRGEQATVDKTSLMQCKECFATFPPPVETFDADGSVAVTKMGLPLHECCPECEAVLPVVVVPERKIEQFDGKLGEITEEMIAKAAAKVAQGRAATVADMVRTLGYSQGRAEKVYASRIEKTALIDTLIDEFDKFEAKTGQNSLSLFNVPRASIRNMKPRELKALREKLDGHMSVWSAVDAPQADLVF